MVCCVAHTASGAFGPVFFLTCRAIIELLTGQVRASNQRYEDVTIKLQELKAELEDERKRHKKEFDEVSAQKDAEILRLTEKTEQQQDKLKELEEFTKQKDSLQKELENEKLQRAQDDRKWREEKTMLERNFVQEKDRWQKELQHQIKETKVRERLGPHLHTLGGVRNAYPS